MRLRKIGLLKSDTRGPFSNLALIGSYPNLNSALGLYCDQVDLGTDQKTIREHLEDCYALSRGPIEQSFSSIKSKMSIYLYADYSESIAGADGLTAKSPRAQNRNAIAAFVPMGEAMGCMSIYPLPGIGKPIMRAPEIRGGVPRFSGGCAYFEIAPWNYRDRSNQIFQKITEFETPQHQRVLEQILRGSLQEYDDSALYEYLVQTGKKEQWVGSYGSDRK